jgi:hypothetical protein
LPSTTIVLITEKKKGWNLFEQPAEAALKRMKKHYWLIRLPAHYASDQKLKVAVDRD